MQKTKRIRDQAAGTKNFPVCRNLIKTQGFVPHVLANSSSMFWDGFTVRGLNGKLTSISPSARKELINMILAGCYGDAVKDAVIDQTTYWKIRDELLEWPNLQKIEQEQLRVVDLKLLDEA